MRMRFFLTAGLALALSPLILAGQANAQVRTYTVTLTDLTSTALNSGQPFSPPVFATHDSTVHLWQSGQTASVGIQHIAEEGDRSFLVSAVTPLVGGSVRDLVTPLTSPLPQGQSVIINITTDAAHPFLSLATMLGWTNDGFTGVDSFDLRTVNGTTSINLFGLDAGTEKNNEAKGFLGALGGGNARDPENGVITNHPGILGIADAPKSWDWGLPDGSGRSPHHHRRAGTGDGEPAGVRSGSARWPDSPPRRPRVTASLF